MTSQETKKEPLSKMFRDEENQESLKPDDELDERNSSAQSQLRCTRQKGTGEDQEKEQRDVKDKEFSQDVDELNGGLGHLSLEKSQEEFDLDTMSTPVLSHTIDCRTPEDETEPYLHDILFMEVMGVETLVVADYMNDCIKSFYNRNGQDCHSRLSYQNKPIHICKLENCKIAVTKQDSRQIVTVSVTPDLILDSTIEVQKQYWGLTALTSTRLAAGSMSPACVDILDLSGNVLKSMNPLYNGEEVIRQPDFLCTTRQGNILVSNSRPSSVVCVTPQGEVVFNYAPTDYDRALDEPSGITSTAAGHILVTDWDVSKVIQLSESGEFVREILTSEDGVCKPFGIDWDETGRIFLVHRDDAEDFIEDVQVYTMK